MNWIRDRVKNGESLIGIWLTMGSSAVAEMAALTGFDWGLIDLEHGTGTYLDVLPELRALELHGVPGIVRVPALDLAATKRVLDFGAAGVMFPQINTAEEAREAVSFTRYPPDGVRGMASGCRASVYGRDFEDYYAKVNDNILTVIQLESAEAVENADAIAAVDGVDVLFIGHSDLSLALGCFQDFQNEKMLTAEATVLAACQRHGKQAGQILRAPATVKETTARGFTFLAPGTDGGCIRKGFQALRETS
jgi:4-hydroxy-2-oxoheptanedioate aldolase